MHIFFNSFAMVMIGITTQSKIAVGLLLGSNVFALGALSYMVNLTCMKDVSSGIKTCNNSIEND